MLIFYNVKKKRYWVCVDPLEFGAIPFKLYKGAGEMQNPGAVEMQNRNGEAGGRVVY